MYQQHICENVRQFKKKFITFRLNIKLWKNLILLSIFSNTFLNHHYSYS